MHYLTTASFPRHIIAGYDARHSEEETPLEILLEESQEPVFEHQSNSIHVKGPLDLIPKESFAYLLLYGFQPAYHSDQQYYLHSATVSKENRSILLLGGSGAGKSTTATALANQKNFYVHGDEAVLVGSEPPRPLHYNTHLAVDPMQIHNLPGFTPHETKPGGGKVFLQRVDEPFPAPPVTDIVFLALNPAVATHRTLDQDYAALKLYEEVSRDIRGAGYYLSVLNEPLKSLDTRSLAKARYEYLHDVVLESANVHRLVGSLDYLVSTIDCF